MAEPKYDKLELVGLHEPDYSMEPNADGGRDKVALPGMYSVGVMIDGKFHAVHSYKAGALVDKKNKVNVGGKESAKADDKNDDSSDES
jgi:hypothetical protein